MVCSDDNCLKVVGGIGAGICDTVRAKQHIDGRLWGDVLDLDQIIT